LQEVLPIQEQQVHRDLRERKESKDLLFGQAHKERQEFREPKDLLLIQELKE